MLNFSNNNGEAKLHYGSSDFMILQSGQYVLCAVTGVKIPLEELKYWSDETQEAYADAAASFKRWQEVNS
ncbi:MAG: hypothetical protein COA43_02705 [Robiginitomaculum sp.]|nr:MAG: hypothetical protein COA43_02705 [Robiginitomaculum sp.]